MMAPVEWCLRAKPVLIWINNAGGGARNRTGSIWKCGGDADRQVARRRQVRAGAVQDSPAVAGSMIANAVALVRESAFFRSCRSTRSPDTALLSERPLAVSGHSRPAGSPVMCAVCGEIVSRIVILGGDDQERRSWPFSASAQPGVETSVPCAVSPPTAPAKSVRRTGR